KVAQRMRFDLVQKFLHTNPMFQSRGADGEDNETSSLVSSCVSNDIRLLREYIVKIFGGMPREGVQLFFLLVTLFLLSSKQAVIFLFGVTPTVYLISR